MTKREKWQQIVQHFAPIVARHKRDDVLWADVAPVAMLERIVCAVCGNPVGRAACKEFDGVRRVNSSAPAIATAWTQSKLN